VAPAVAEAVARAAERDGVARFASGPAGGAGLSSLRGGPLAAPV